MNQNPTMENASDNLSLILNPKKVIEDIRQRQRRINLEVSEMVGELK